MPSSLLRARAPFSLFLIYELDKKTDESQREGRGHGGRRELCYAGGGLKSLETNTYPMLFNMDQGGNGVRVIERSVYWHSKN